MGPTNNFWTGSVAWGMCGMGRKGFWKQTESGMIGWLREMERQKFFCKDLVKEGGGRPFFVKRAMCMGRAAAGKALMGRAMGMDTASCNVMGAMGGRACAAAKGNGMETTLGQVNEWNSAVCRVMGSLCTVAVEWTGLVVFLRE